MKVASKLVVNYEAWSMIQSFIGTCFRHAFSKAFQHSTYDERVSKGIKYVSIKLVQVNLQKCITWPKKSKKGKHEWIKVYITTNLKPIKLNRQIKINIKYKFVILFVLNFSFGHLTLHFSCACHNPSLGLMTKARGVARLQPIRKLRSHISCY
jgi:hypothetical protein